MRIVDFAYSSPLAELQNELMENRDVGTAYYKAPEISRSERVQDGTKSDVFALGCILFIMYFRAYPWAEERVPPHQYETFYEYVHTQRPDQFWRA